MSNRALTASLAASATATLVPEIPALGALDALGPLGKIALGAAAAWFCFNKSGMAMAVGLGIGLGLVVDGLVDLTVGTGFQQVRA